MAANTSQSKVLSIVYQAKVAEYATWSLIVACKPCSAVRTVSLVSLLSDLTVMEVLMRMRCRTCHGRVYAAALDNNLPGWRGRIVRVWGPSAYG